MPRVLWIGKRLRFALVDDADFERLAQFHWHACRDFKYPDNWWVRREIKGGTCMMHWDVLGAREHRAVPIVADHMNGYGWDNRRHNLRWLTQAENARYRHRGRGRAPWLDHEAKDVIMRALGELQLSPVEFQQRRTHLQSLGIA